MHRTVALAVAALGLILAPSSFAPADAQEGDEAQVSVEITEPTTDPVSGTTQVVVEVTETYDLQQIRSYQVELRDADGEAAGVFCSETYEGDENPPPEDSLTLAFVWDATRDAPDEGVQNCDGDNPELGGTPIPNGGYRIHATATLTDHPLTGESPSDSDELEVGVRNPAEEPTGVELSYDEDEERIGVSWNAVSHQYDLDGYRIQECIVASSSDDCDSGDWQSIADTSSVAVSFKSAGPGVYRYRVASLRSDESGEEAQLVSTWARPEGEPTEIEVEEEPEPTTTTAPDEDDEETSTTESDETGGASESTETTRPPADTRPRRVERTSPQVVEQAVEEDRGFEEELPYGASGEQDGEALGGRPLAGSGEGDDDQRAFLVPLAGGTLLLIFAGQVWYLNRRADRALEPVAPSDLGDS